VALDTMPLSEQLRLVSLFFHLVKPVAVSTA